MCLLFQNTLVKMKENDKLDTNFIGVEYVYQSIIFLTLAESSNAEWLVIRAITISNTFCNHNSFWKFRLVVWIFKCIVYLNPNIRYFLTVANSIVTKRTAWGAIWVCIAFCKIMIKKFKIIIAMIQSILENKYCLIIGYIYSFLLLPGHSCR